jgi:hypothetical protein
MILLTHIIFIDNNNSFSRWRNYFNSIINIGKSSVINDIIDP